MIKDTTSVVFLCEFCGRCSPISRRIGGTNGQHWFRSLAESRIPGGRDFVGSIAVRAGPLAGLPRIDVERENKKVTN
ncbi:unnamed protein product [Calypogeia fissa]